MEQYTSVLYQRNVGSMQLIHDGVRDIRNSLPMNQNPDEDVDSENKHEGW